ncbi:MFS transporter [Corallincola platygyrae]|uniref:MFS transporter n=1 Tax=Corallincola platygyrae TaxID=1193278 RepID=A0ABW4XL08_9GAMM
MKVLSVFAIYLVLFSQMLDTSVANVALINIAADLALDTFYASLIMTSIGTGLVISFPLGNLLTRKLANNAVFILGALIFLVSSLLCGLANDVYSFILFRFMQGLSAGMAVVTSFSLMTVTLGKERQALAIALCTSAISLAPVFGPFVGAYITDMLGWRWLFFINVPLITISLLILLPKLETTLSKDKFDYGPLITLSIFGLSIAAFQYCLDFGEKYGWFTDLRIQGGCLLGVLFLAFFLLSNQRWMLVDFSLLRNAQFRTSTFILCIGNGVIFSSIVILPIWLRMDKSYTILQAGMILSISSVIAAILSPLIGRHVKTQYYVWISCLSLLLMAISFYMMSQFKLNTSETTIVISRIIAGLSLATFTAPLLSLSLEKLEQSEVTSANSLSLILRIFSANLFTSLSFIFYKKLTLQNEGEYISKLDRLTLVYMQDTNNQVYHSFSIFRTNALAEMFLYVALFFLLSSVAITVLRRQQSELPASAK